MTRKIKKSTTIKNCRIEHYMLIGRYGPEKQEQIETEIKTGKCKSLDKAILAGEYGKSAMQLLKGRPRRRPSTDQKIDQTLARLFPEIFN